MRKSVWAGVVALVVAACAAPHAPPELVGDIPITFVNDASDPLCELLVVDPSRVNRDNWVGSRPIKPGGKIELKIKAGLYIVKVRGCQRALNAPDVDLYTGTLQQMDVSGPTMVSIGGRPQPPPGFKGVSVPIQPVQSQVAAPPPRGGPSQAEPANCGGFMAGCAHPGDPPCCGGFYCKAHQCEERGH